MAVSLPLDKMSLAEKQEAMEILWADLYGHEEELPVPEWQVEILREREAAAARGENPLMDLEEARSRFRSEFRCK